MLAKRVKLKNIREVEVIEVRVSGLDVKIIKGYNENKEVKEVFIRVGKQGTTINGFMEFISKMTSKMLQYGIPKDVIIDMCRGQIFEPKGTVVGHSDIEVCTSLVDLLAIVLEDNVNMYNNKEHSKRGIV